MPMSSHPPRYPDRVPTETASVVAMATTVTPIRTEDCAPNSTRLNTSRPCSSVPNRCAADGPSRRCETSKASYAYGARMPAIAAHTTRSRTMQAVTAPIGSRCANQSSFDHTLRVMFGCAPMGTITRKSGPRTALAIRNTHRHADPRVGAPSGVFDPWVQHGVGQVHYDVGDDDHRRRQQDDRLDHRIVAL